MCPNIRGVGAITPLPPWFRRPWNNERERQDDELASESHILNSYLLCRLKLHYEIMKQRVKIKNENIGESEMWRIMMWIRGSFKEMIQDC